MGWMAPLRHLVVHLLGMKRFGSSVDRLAGRLLPLRTRAIGKQAVPAPWRILLSFPRTPSSTLDQNWKH